MNHKPRLIIGVCGGIAAVLIPALIKRLKVNADVTALLTKHATNFITPEQLGVTVHTDLFEKPTDVELILKTRSVEHIALANSASLYVIVPATANTIAKLAHGIADDYVTTTALAATCPVLVIPSMNVYMWRHAVTQQNVHALRLLGYHIFGPDSGMLACGYEGEGRLPEIGSIEQEIHSYIFRSQALQGKKVLVTCGGTTEPIDMVRSITNRSSGKMGCEIARSAYFRGADVTLLRSESSVLPRVPVSQEIFTTAQSLARILQKHSGTFDIIIHTAAVSDFTFQKPFRGKISSSQPLPLELTPSAKILDSLRSDNPNAYIVGFKAEYRVTKRTLVDKAFQTLQKSNADCIVANDIGADGIGFMSDDNQVVLVYPDATTVDIPKSSKRQIADSMFDALAEKIRAHG